MGGKSKAVPENQILVVGNDFEYTERHAPLSYFSHAYNLQKVSGKLYSVTQEG